MLGLRDLGTHHGRPVWLWVVAAATSLLRLRRILAGSVVDVVVVGDCKVWGIHDEIGWSCSWKWWVKWVLISSSYAKHRRNRLSLCLGSWSTCLSSSRLVPGRNHFSCHSLFIYPEKRSDSDLNLNIKPLSFAKSLCLDVFAVSTEQMANDTVSLVCFVSPMRISVRVSDQGQSHCCILLAILHVVYSSSLS